MFRLYRKEIWVSSSYCGEIAVVVSILKTTVMYQPKKYRCLSVVVRGTNTIWFGCVVRLKFPLNTYGQTIEKVNAPFPKCYELYNSLVYTQKQPN